MPLRFTLIFGIAVLLGCDPSRAPAGDGIPLLQTRSDGLATPDRPLGVYYADTLPTNVAYLSFDDGPSEWTEGFLAILAEKTVRATFFVNGIGVKGPAGVMGSYVDAATGKTISYASVLKHMQDDGHDIGNHTLHHDDLGLLNDAEITTQLDENQVMVNAALLKAGGERAVMSLVRPPFGSPWRAGNTVDNQARVGTLIADHGLNILWSLDSTDSVEWAEGEWYSSQGGVTKDGEPRSYNPSKSEYKDKVRRITNAVLTSLGATGGRGIVVLFHDTHPTSRDALRAVIDGLRAKGYRFDTLEKLVASRWGRPSEDLSPGPGLFKASIAERNWGCDDSSAFFEAPLRQREHEICGRLWRQYAAYGGSTVLGHPVRSPSVDASSFARAQWLERARLVLRPELARPADVEIAAVGEERLTQLKPNWRSSGLALFQPEPAPLIGCVWQDRTRRNVCDRTPDSAELGFATLWKGREHLFGNPVTRAYWDAKKGAWVQWFQKARLERRPDSAQPTLAPLGLELLSPSEYEAGFDPEPSSLTEDAGIVPTDPDGGAVLPTAPASPDPTEGYPGQPGGCGCGSGAGLSGVWLTAFALFFSASQRRIRRAR
ncbi:MAG: polysaccharide deacetylase family protein [Myxococcaceae bacterium]